MKEKSEQIHKAARKVLLVDDDEDIRLILKKILELKGGYQVEEARNGAEALKKLEDQSFSPCMIFLDLMMPIMDGWMFMKEKSKMSSQISNIPTVVLTASNSNKLPENVQKVLRKPVAIRDVLGVCQNHC